MKTWMLLAAALAVTVPARAQQLPVDETLRANLILEEDAFRDVAFPPDAQTPLADELKPKFARVRAQAVAAKSAAELLVARRAYNELKTKTKQRVHWATGDATHMTRTQSDALLEGKATELLQLRQFATAKRTATIISPIFGALNSGGLSNVFTGGADRNKPLIEGANVNGVNALDAYIRSSGRTVPSSTRPLSATTPATRDAIVLPAGAERYTRVKAALLGSYRAELQREHPRGLSGAALESYINKQMADRAQTIDIAIKTGLDRKVDPMIVLSVIDQESRFKQGAYNKGSGCTGLMQLDAGTAGDMGVHGSLYDKTANILAGTKYIEWIANKFFKMNLDMRDVAKIPAQKLKIVLAAYNWGIGNVQNSLRRHGGALASLPGETAAYIAQIPGRIQAWFSRS